MDDSAALLDLHPVATIASMPLAAVKSVHTKRAPVSPNAVQVCPHEACATQSGIVQKRFRDIGVVKAHGTEVGTVDVRRTVASAIIAPGAWT